MNDLNNPNVGGNSVNKDEQQQQYQQPNNQQAGYQQPNNQQAGFQQPNNQQDAYQQPNNQQDAYQQPNNQQPLAQQPYQSYPPFNTQDQKSKIAAGLLGIFLGSFGVHNFYLGFMGKAFAQLAITVLSCGMLAVVSSIWGLIEGILILTGSTAVDARGIPLKD